MISIPSSQLKQPSFNLNIITSEINFQKERKTLNKSC